MHNHPAGCMLHGVDDEAVRALYESLAKLPPLGRWVTEASCRGMPEVFGDKPSADTLSLVESVCDACPVFTACQAFAASNVVFGVYAGTFHTVRGAFGVKAA